MSDLAPIVLFVYNRPWHTQQTLEALSTNDLANQSILYVFGDGPKIDASPEQLELLDQTRSVVKSKQWCKEVFFEMSDSNKGLMNSIILGVTKIVNKHGKVIVLEDDLVPSKGFLRYMNDALRVYQDVHEVMHISAYMYPVPISSENIVFLKVLSCWGWATWQRAWQYFEFDVDAHLTKVVTKQQINKFNIEGNADFYGQLRSNKNGRMRTWAVRWYSSWLHKGGFAIFPHKTLINNIGHDGSGDNCPPESKFFSPAVEQINVPLLKVEESLPARKAIDTFYKNLFYQPWHIRMQNFILSNSRKWVKKLIRKK